MLSAAIRAFVAHAVPKSVILIRWTYFSNGNAVPVKKDTKLRNTNRNTERRAVLSAIAERLVHIQR